MDVPQTLQPYCENIEDVHFWRLMELELFFLHKLRPFEFSDFG